MALQQSSHRHFRRLVVRFTLYFDVPTPAKGSMEEGGEGEEGDADLHGVWCCVVS